MTGPSSPHSHPDAPVRHSYPLAIEEAGFGTALSLMSRTLPYAVVRNQTIDLEWDQRLTSLSRKFQDIKDKAGAGWSPAPQPVPGSLPPAS
jgi:hypothetical protein